MVHTHGPHSSRVLRPWRSNLRYRDGPERLVRDKVQTRARRRITARFGKHATTCSSGGFSRSCTFAFTVMSRIPQPPSSRSTARTPSKAPSTPSAQASVASGSSSRKPPPSLTPGSRTLRPQASLKSVKPPPSLLKSPVRQTIKPIEDDPGTTARAQSASIREQIALRRAEAKKAMSKTPAASPLDDFNGLEDALPTRSKSPDDSLIDLGRWSVKETIERGRTTGECSAFQA